jgi:hypothetical protein
VNKQGSEVICRVESLSNQDSLGMLESFFIVSEPFNEEKIINVYRECPSKSKDLFLQTIVKPEHFSKSVFANKCDYNGY